MNRESLAKQDQTDPAEFDPAALADSPNSRLAGFTSAALTLATLAAIILAANKLSFHAILALLPSTPLFWIAFALYYTLPPASEWLMFRRLWALPAGGFAALLRKYVCNEVLLGYLGEAQFYTWARGRLNLQTAPFGAIKDVAILSAMIGNLITLILLVAVWPLIGNSAIGLDLRSTFLSLAVVLASSFVVFFFRKRLFSLPAPELRYITAMHVGRIVITLLLTAWMWHLVLPAVELAPWLLLATLRMLVSRLPLLPNKDLVFVGLAMFTLGNEPQLASMLAMMAGLILLTHIIVGLVCTLGAVLFEGARK
jgi:hypothetical protein